MTNELQTFENEIKSKIHTVRNVQVMLDEDLAKLYKVETKQLNRAVKRNIERFPEAFMFQLTNEENDSLRFQNGTSNSNRGGRRYLPLAFTEQGVAMLSGVLSSEVAIEISIQIMNTFVSLRKLSAYNSQIDQRFNRVEVRLLEHDQEFNKVFDAIESKKIKPDEGIFYNGQIFDSYVFASGLIKIANKSIILVDNYIDESIFLLLTKNTKEIPIKIFTKKIDQMLSLDFKKYSSQYKNISLIQTDDFHDRFLVIDDDAYHIGASLKDLGKKCFAFSKIKETGKLFEKLKG